MIQKCKENISILLCILALFALTLVYYSLSSDNTQEITTGLPMVHITTASREMPSCTDIAAPEGCWGASTTDKVYESCLITIDYGIEQYTVAGRIKVRGNTSSYNNNKRSYKLKLDKRLDLMRGGRAPSKNWALLNNGTSLNTLLGTWMAEKMGMPYVPRVQMVSVDINGEWRGLYYLTDTVEASSNRIDISKNGIIVENDPYWWNGEIYFRIENQINPLAFTIKYPKEPSKRQYQEIKNYFEYVFGLIQDDNPDAMLFIDPETFVRWVMIRDILRSGDSGGSNMYYVLDSIIDWENNNEKLKMIPAWDFDACLTGSESWYETMDSTWSIQHTDFITYFPELFKIKEFNDEYYLTWQQLRDELYSEIRYYLFDYADNYGRIIQEYRDKEQKRWDKQLMSFEDEVEYDLRMIKGQISWIDEGYADWLKEGQ